MTLEEVTNRFGNFPMIKYLIIGIKPEDGNFSIDVAACITRQDAINESKKFLKYVLYDVEKSKNQNL